jgi:uncharacterized membrane-anchored protein YitT (DUF2179 family)
MTRANCRRLLTDLFYDGLSGLLMSVAVQLLAAPNHIVAGGVSGVATLINYLYGLPIATISLLFNLPLMLWGYRELGRGFILSTLRTLAVHALIMDGLFARMPFLFYRGESMLAAIFGGVFLGMSLAIVFYRGGSTGGSDILTRIIKKHWPHFSLGAIMLALDALVVAAATVIYGDIEAAMYAYIMIGMSTLVLDAMILGFDKRTFAFIMTNRPQEITDYITGELERSATLIEGRGAYTGKPVDVLLCAVSSAEFYRLKARVAQIDPAAFVIVTEAGQIFGEGFKHIHAQH